MNIQTTLPSEGTTSPPDTAVRRGVPAGAWIGAGVGAALLLLLIVVGILHRASAEHQLAQSTRESAIPVVAVTRPVASRVTPDLALPGNTQAFTDTPIYSRTTGYLKQWIFDIGAHVRKGQLMAIIESPEVDQQLQVAQANLKSAQADLNLAQTTATRYQNLLRLNSVSQQETDQATSNALARKAAVDAAQAGVRRLEQLQGFERVYAPFTGIVTARNTDVGALIEAGAEGSSASTTAAKELFHLAAIGTIRVFVPVPEVYSAGVRDGSEATLTLDEYPGQTFDGTIARNSSAIDPSSRTLNVEVDVPNPKGKLLPGAYVFVHFKIPNHTPTMTIPSNTLLFRGEGLQVGVVRNGKVALVPVKIAHDNGATVQIDSGLEASDQIILDPSDSLTAGQEVRINSNGVGSGTGTSAGGSGNGAGPA